ncbi:MAG: hypothetical protein Q8L48_07100 [Archangium sp.]|nr:hypothetical protein [Archangium sp.]
MRLKILFVAVAASSCANQAQPIFIEKFFPLGDSCDATKTSENQPNGYLDVAAGNPQFFVGVRVSGSENVGQVPVTVGTVQLERANRDRPIIKQMVVTYRLSKRVGGTPRPYIQNMSIPLEEGAALQLISPELGTALFDGLVPPPGPAPSAVVEDHVDISADVEFRGNYSSSGNAFSTGILTFPIRAYRSLPVTCPNGYVRFANDPTAGSVDFCKYTGQTRDQLVPATPPSCCPAVGTPGC